MKLIFSSNIAWSIYNFRKDLLLSLKEDGYEIHCVSNGVDYSAALESLGFKFHLINVNNNQKNPFADLLLIRDYYKIYKNIGPDIILHNAIKPNIYGTIAAGILKIPVINNISGLGTLFIKKSLSTKIAKILYWISQKMASVVFFQNIHDLKLFTKNGLVPERKAKLVPGSGVNTKVFVPDSKNEEKKNFIFLFVGRFLKDKGILELLEASKLLKEKGEKFVVHLVGSIYKDNETSISESTLKIWEKNEYIINIGQTDNVVNEMSKVDCLVLPSYREGLSKVLIEGSAMGLPIVTTRVPGCMDVIIDNETGLLCDPKNVTDLVDKMELILNMSNIERKMMGEKSRERAISVFDIGIVINKYKKEISSILN